MAKSRFRVTGFARFVLMLIIVTPLAYLGASYINGEDGIENLKNIFKGEQNVEETQKPAPRQNDAEEAEMPAEKPEAVKQNKAALERLESELEYQTRLNQELKDENESLKRNLWEKDQEIARLKGQE